METSVTIPDRAEIAAAATDVHNALDRYRKVVARHRAPGAEDPAAFIDAARAHLREAAYVAGVVPR